MKYELLPIGSVVMLKDATKSLMVIGRFQVDMEDKEIYDYAGCMYPEGFLNAQELFLFQAEDIETILFKGMQNEEELAFREKLKSILEKREEFKSEL